jgi:hypothetical protein
MAINYPTSLDTFTNPSASSLLTSPSHAQQHADINDAMEAVQTKLAIGNTVIGTYTDYSASLTMATVTVGNGTKIAYYAQVNDYVHFFGKFLLGSTSAILGPNIQVTLPISLDTNMRATGQPLGLSYSYDVSAGGLYNGDVLSVGVPSAVYLSTFLTNGTYSKRTNMNATVPFTWATGDFVFWNLYYKAA